MGTSPTRPRAATFCRAYDTTAPPEPLSLEATCIPRTIYQLHFVFPFWACPYAILRFACSVALCFGPSASALCKWEVSWHGIRGRGALNMRLFAIRTWRALTSGTVWLRGINRGRFWVAGGPSFTPHPSFRTWSLICATQIYPPSPSPCHSP